MIEVGRESSLVLVLVDLVPAVLKGIAVVLYPAVVELLPLALVDLFQQGQFLLLGQDVFNQEEPWDGVGGVFLGTVGNVEYLFLLQEGLLAEEEHHGPLQILKTYLLVEQWLVLDLLLGGKVVKSVFDRSELKDAVRMSRNDFYLPF